MPTKSLKFALKTASNGLFRATAHREASTTQTTIGGEMIEKLDDTVPNMATERDRGLYEIPRETRSKLNEVIDYINNIKENPFSESQTLQKLVQAVAKRRKAEEAYKAKREELSAQDIAVEDQMELVLPWMDKIKQATVEMYEALDECQTKNLTNNPS